jgi:hypothetical protein
MNAAGVRKRGAGTVGPTADLLAAARRTDLA